MNPTKPNSQDYEALVMIVDDNPVFLDGIELALEMEGFKVWRAINGQHALDELKAVFDKEDPERTAMERLPDLIVADIMMPVMDGYDFYDRVRTNPYTNHVPFIFLSAKDADNDIRYGKELGSDDYLPKLCSSEDLLASIRGKLNRIKQRQLLAAQYIGGEDNGPPEGNIISRTVLLIIFVFLVLAFSLGVATVTGLLW